MAYEQAQRWTVQAEEALRCQDRETAYRLFREAARIQQEYVRQLPEDRRRSRSVYGLSAAILYYRGNDLEEAARLAHQLLGSGPLEPRAEEQLEELLRRIQTA